MNPGRPIRSVERVPRVAGVRRYRVWWLQGRAEAVPAPRRKIGRWRRLAVPCGSGMGRAMACGFCALWADTFALCLAATLLVVLIAVRRCSRCIEERPHRLRRLGARPGPWIWAIDAEAAVCTARIRAGMPDAVDQPRRKPSMRIQSPSCSQRKPSNQAA